MTKVIMPLLAPRMEAYLKRSSEKWISWRELVRLAKQAGYTDTEIAEADKSLQDNWSVGMKYEDGRRVFIWYDLSAKELDRAKRQKKFFEEL